MDELLDSQTVVTYHVQYRMIAGTESIQQLYHRGVDPSQVDVWIYDICAPTKGFISRTLALKFAATESAEDKIREYRVVKHVTKLDVILLGDGLIKKESHDRDGG